jgi:hypothetical protein
VNEVVPGMDLTKMVKYDAETNTYDFSGLNDYVNSVGAETEIGKGIIAWQNNLNAQVNTTLDAK